MKSSTCSTSSLGGLKSVLGSGGFLLGGFVVDRMPRLVRFMWPLAVAVDSGKYFLTRSEEILGKPISWSLSMALHNVSKVGENKHWCRNLIVSDMVVVWKALLALWSVLVSSMIVKDLLFLVSGMYHSLFFLLRIPLLTSCLLYNMTHSSLSNNT